MGLNKKLREAKKEIMQTKDFMTDSEDNAVINIKASKEEQIFSEYNYDSNAKLSNDLNNFIKDKAKLIPINRDIKIKVYTSDSVNGENVKKAIKDNFKKEYIEARSDLKKNAFFSLVMLFVGLISLAFLLLMHTYFYNIYFEVVVEIISWVFVWEAVDTYFLRRAELRRRAMMVLKLHSANIEIIKLKSLTQKNKEQ